MIIYRILLYRDRKFALAEFNNNQWNGVWLCPNNEILKNSWHLCQADIDKIYFNSIRWAISVLKKRHPKALKIKTHFHLTNVSCCSEYKI